MASPKRTRLYQPAPSTSNDSGLDIWSQAVAPYLSDPFRGNVERRVLGPGESSLTLECGAAKDALNAAKLSPDEVELAIVASIFPEQLVPGNASYLARQLELRCPAWNLESTCSSALVALQNASALVQTGEYRNVLVVVSHIDSHSVDEEDSLSWSMGDGAGAFVVDSLKFNQGVLANKIVHTAATCGAYLHELVTDAQGKPRMRTRTGENASTFAETSVEFVRTCCQGAIAAAGVTLDQIDFFAFNTPTAWYADVCTRALGINPERTINLYPQYANIGSVHPIANLYHAALTGKIRENDLVLAYTNGAAATAAATVMRWGDVKLGPAPTPPIHVTHEEDRIHPAEPDSISIDILHHSQEPPVGCVRRSRRAPLSSDSVGYAAANPPDKLLIENGARSESTQKLLAAQKASLSREKLLAASPEKRQEILQTYLLEWLTNSLQLPLAQLNPQQSLASFVDSLMAFELRSRIEVDLQVRVSIEKFFGDNNITQLAELLLNQLVLTNLIPSSLPAIVPAPELRYEPFPLTDMQHAFWVGRSGVLELGNVANHGYYEIECIGLDLERLNWALQKLIERHDMLRAIVLPDGQQQILEQVPPYQIEVLDLRGQDDQAVTFQIEAIRQRMSHQVLPADQWPLFEFRATRLDEERVRLHISYDLQVFDAWSLFRLFDEWFQLYQNPQVELTPLELSFRDYVLVEQALQDTELYRRSQDYWLSRLNDLPPAPDLPLAKNPSELKQHRCKRYQAGLELTVWQQLKQRAAKAGLTPSGVLLAAFAEILSRWSKSPRFTLNLALFNRLPLHPQVNDLLGDFTSVTLLAVDNSTPEPFTDRSVRLQQQLWQDLEHRYFSGVRVTRELARRRGTVPSAMPVVFTSTLGFGSLGQDTLTFSHFGEVVYGISQASQAWMDVQVWEEKGELTFNWDVVEELFPEGLIGDMFEAYCRFLKQLATSESAWVETRREIIPPSQLAQRDVVNVVPIPDELLHTLFAAQVQGRSNSPAVVSSQRTLTYQDLYERSNQLAHRLRSLGATPNRLIAVVMEKGWEQIVAVLGILAAGAAYVPIDSELPQERLWYLLENSQAKIVLTQSWLSDKLAFPEGIQRLCIDDLSSESKEPLQPVQTPDDLAYVIYTSGSTGLPKGVAIAHRGVVNAIVQTNQVFNITAGDRVLALTALNHDMSIYDIFGILAAGGTIVIPEAASRKDPAHWVDLISQENITIWNSVPAMMEMLLEYVGVSEAQTKRDRSELLPQSLRWAFLGGDWISVTLPKRLQTLIENVRVVSVGGPTETTLWNIWYPVEAVNPIWKSIPYGQAIANTKYYVLNEALDDCPTWVPGELCCAGIGLAKGYWCNEEKTRASFITHPRTGERIYRTGDLGRYCPDGTLEFLGRVDFQIKIRGHRIEVGEIEAALTQHPAVRSAVVDAIGKQHNKERLVAYIVPDQKWTPEVEKLHHFLSRKLPPYMVPSAFIFLEALPLSANGKVDRRQLNLQEGLIQELEVPYIAPQNHLEQTIATVWQEVLQLAKVGVNDNFFDSGGNSLLITKVYSKLKTVLPNEVEHISLTDLFKYSTIRAIAKYLSQAAQSSSLQPNNAELEQKLKEGKARFKQRFLKSRLANKLSCI